MQVGTLVPIHDDAPASSLPPEAASVRTDEARAKPPGRAPGSALRESRLDRRESGESRDARPGGRDRGDSTAAVSARSPSHP